MLHVLKFYSSNRPFVLRLYIFFAAWTKIPVIGGLARRVANAYGRSNHRAYLLTPAEADELVKSAGALAVGHCDCRAVFKKCRHPVESEILLGPNQHVLHEAMPPGSREITKEEALKILEANRRSGLIQTIVKCGNVFYAMCSCCSCCCVPLRLSKQYGIGDALVRHDNIVQEFKSSQEASRETA
jgi:hypothetical protein